MAKRFNRTARNNLLRGGVSDSALGKAFVSALKADFARHGASRIRKLLKTLVTSVTATAIGGAIAAYLRLCWFSP